MVAHAVVKGLGLLRRKVPSCHLKVPFAVSFGWSAFPSRQHQLSSRVLVDVHRPRIRDLASLVLVTDKGDCPGCSGHRLRLHRQRGEGADSARAHSIVLLHVPRARSPGTAFAGGS